MYSDKDLKATISEYKELWHNAFGDSYEFIDFYFEKKLQPENFFTIVKNGHLVSALLAVPYSMTLSNSYLSNNSGYNLAGYNLIRVAYLTGVATKKEEQGKGYMQKLINQAITELQRRSYAMVFLIIQDEKLYSFYEQFGFAPIVKHKVDNIKILGATPNIDVKILRTPPKGSQLEELYNYFNSKMLQRPGCIQHDITDFKAALEYHFSSGGKLYTAQEVNDIKGVAFALPKQAKGLKISEILYDNETIKNALLSTVSALESAPVLDCITPALNGQDGMPYGMIRVTDALKTLKIYALGHPNMKKTISVIDEFIPCNNKIFLIQNGGVKVLKQSEDKSLLTLSIKELTSLLLEECPCYGSLMMDE